MAIAEVRGRAYRFLQEKARAIWAALLGALAPGGEGANAAGGPIGGGGPQGPPPSLNNPAAGPAQLLSSLWTSYGPGIVAGGTALLRQTAASTLPSGLAGASAADPAERRRQLEAELASLPPSTSSIPIPSANNPARPSRTSTPSSSGSSSSVVRERTMSGKFEEIKGGDVDGYDVGDDFEGGFPVGGPTVPKNTRGSSWFGGWGGSSGKGSYERVKDE
jgi:receptor expression-enhancing protein 1/2/3/4